MCVSSPGCFPGKPWQGEGQQEQCSTDYVLRTALSFHFLEVEVSRSPEGFPVSGGSTVYSFPGMVYSELDVSDIEEYTFC